MHPRPDDVFFECLSLSDYEKELKSVEKHVWIAHLLQLSLKDAI